jgi:RNA polymerase sigma-70 factor (ECF subfamily)
MTHATDPFRTLYDANRGRILRVLARLVGPQDAEDLAQIVFAKAARAMPGFRGAADASTWLHRIAVNAASDWLRSRAMQESKLTLRLPDPSDEASAEAIGAGAVDRGASPEQLLTNKDMHGCIRGEIGKLPDTLRTVFMLSALGGLSDHDVAATLGISHDNAKVRLHRARREFRKIIAARCDFYRNELSCKPASPDCCAPARAAGSPGART